MAVGLWGIWTDVDVDMEAAMTGVNGGVPTHVAAAMLGVKPRTLDDWRYRGVGPKFAKGPGGRMVYRREDVEAFREAWRRDPSLTGRKDKPVLQKRLDARGAQLEKFRAEIERLESELAQMRKQSSAQCVRLEETESEVERLSEEAEKYRLLAVGLKLEFDRVNEQLGAYRDGERREGQLVEMLTEDHEALSARYERERVAGRVVALDREPLAEMLGINCASTMRERLVVLYTGHVRRMDGRYEPLGPRKPSEAIKANSFLEQLRPK